MAAVRSDAAVLLTERQIGADAEELTVASMDEENDENSGTKKVGSKINHDASRSNSGRRQRLKRQKRVPARPNSESFPEPFEGELPAVFRVLSALLQNKLEKPLWKLFQSFSERTGKRAGVSHGTMISDKVGSMPRVLTWKKMAQLAAARNILNQSPSRAASSIRAQWSEIPVALRRCLAVANLGPSVCGRRHHR